MAISPPFWQRILGASLYLIPLSDAHQFAFYSGISNYYWIKIIFLATYPIAILESLFPLGLGSLILFIGLFLLVVRNNNISYFLRFNTLQAILLKIILSITSYGLLIFFNPSLWETIIFKAICGAIVVTMLSILAFVATQCSRGIEPDLPGISQAVRMQIY
tara:strand:+ start:189 stop:671 length:483 start_codon:yes stop_codon:yes gene_type:complete